ncbi:MAG: ABC transporter permease [Neomegalonema sp.]|nr:ABC transporter permease [Neomegalonema sp.]
MSELRRTYGPWLAAFFFAAVAFWAVVLIIAPQFSIFEVSMRQPERQLDSAVAATLARDARTCQTVLAKYDLPLKDSAPSNGGLAIPNMGGMAVPSAGGMAIPTLGGAAPSKQVRPYILQCDRARTDVKLVRPDIVEAVTLRAEHDLPALSVDPGRDLKTQMQQAERIAVLAEALADRLAQEEAQRSPYGLGNYQILASATEIPLSPESLAADRTRFWSQVQRAIGLRYEQGGKLYARLGLTTLFMTLAYAVMATGLSLAICYPIAYNVALGSRPAQAAWLMLGLLIPYAIVELMRIYAWVSILENNGLLNQLLDWAGLLSIEAGEAIQFKRSPLTVFVVIVYTYILFMVFPLVNVMSTLDRSQIEAARDLGASTWRLHWRVVIPHAKPGIAVGCIATFMLCAGAFSVPRIISRGLQSEWFTQTIYNKFFESQNGNVGAAYAFAFMALCFVLVALFMTLTKARLKDFVR